MPQLSLAQSLTIFHGGVSKPFSRTGSPPVILPARSPGPAISCPGPALPPELHKLTDSRQFDAPISNALSWQTSVPSLPLVKRPLLSFFLPVELPQATPSGCGPAEDLARFRLSGIRLEANEAVYHGLVMAVASPFAGHMSWDPALLSRSSHGGSPSFVPFSDYFYPVIEPRNCYSCLVSSFPKRPHVSASSEHSCCTTLTGPPSRAVPLYVSTMPGPSDSKLEWEARKSMIMDLYSTQEKELPEVMKIMKETHGFVARYASVLFRGS